MCQGSPESSISKLCNPNMDYVMRTCLNECKKNDIELLELNYNIPLSALQENCQRVASNWTELAMKMIFS